MAIALTHRMYFTRSRFLCLTIQACHRRSLTSGLTSASLFIKALCAFVENTAVHYCTACQAERAGDCEIGRFLNRLPDNGSIRRNVLKTAAERIVMQHLRIVDAGGSRNCQTLKEFSEEVWVSAIHRSRCRQAH